jgi:hypothetical protein
MGKRKLLGALGMGVALPVATQAGVVINFHDATQGTIPGYNQLYFGQGAYSDPGNNVWNGFSSATYAGGGPGSTLFYGAMNHYPATGGDPGNPYAAYGANGGITGSGSVLFGTGGTIDASGNPTSTAAGNATSAGQLSPITLSMNYSSDNGATAGSVLGQPSWLLTAAAITQTTGTFTLHHVPAGTYTLYLYGTNYDATRGAAFAITVGGGTAMGGITTTLNTGQRTSFVLGDNYVVFNGVSPNASGDISGTWGDVTNPTSMLNGEGDFNGLQLVQATVPEPSILALMVGLGTGGLALRRRRRNG